MTRSNDSVLAVGTRFLLALSLLAALAAAPAAAISSSDGGGSHPSPSGIDVLCEGDCSQLADLSLPPGSNVDFDFEIGVKAIDDGLDLRISSGGNVFVLGPLSATGAIDLRAEGDVVFGDGAGSKRDSETIVNLDRGLVTEIDAPNLTVLSQRNGEYCACVTVAGGGTLRAGGDIALSAAAATEETSEPPQTPEAGLWIARNGDIYIDLSMVELESIWIKALGSIVVSDLDSTPVPEPGPALLVGLGLIALASRRR